MSTFVAAIFYAKEEAAVVEGALVASLRAAKYEPTLSQALVREPLGEKFYALHYLVGDEGGETRSERLGAAMELLDDDEGIGLLKSAYTALGKEPHTFFGLLYTDMFQFEKAWRYSQSGWESRGIHDNQGMRDGSDGKYEGESVIPDLAKFPDEESNLAEQERLSRAFDPLVFLSSEMGISREDILGTGYGLDEGMVIWRQLVNDKQFADWIGDLQSQLVTRDPKQSWRELIDAVKGDTPNATKSLVSRAELAMTAPTVADGMLQTAQEVARIAVVNAPSEASPIVARWAGPMRRALGEVPDAPTLETLPAMLGVLAYMSTTGGWGQGVPDAFYSVEKRWIGQLAIIAHESKSKLLGRVVAFAALGAGLGDLVPIMMGEGEELTGAATPQDKPTTIKACAYYFARALKQGLSADDVRPAYVDFIECFPGRLEDNELTWVELMWVARMYYVQFERKRPTHVGQSLHRAVMEILDPPKPQVRGPPPTLPTSGLRPSRPAVLSRPSGWYRLDLQDVHGLWGGMNVSLFGDGESWVEQVERGGGSARLFRRALPDTTMNELGALLHRHDPRGIRIPPRHGVGGEGCPVITIITPGWRFAVSKWANDKHPDFDALMNWIKALGAACAKEDALVWYGRFDYHWRPDGVQ